MRTRFTRGAVAVLGRAEREARRFRNECVGTEHLLLGLVREGSGAAADVLKDLDVDVRKIRLEVEKIIQTGPGGDRVPRLRLPHTPRAKQAIEYAAREAGDLNRAEVDTEHLLLGLAREEQGVAAQVLLNLGVSPADVRAGVRRLAVDAAWLWRHGGTVEALARGLASSRTWAGLPALADALEEAGCENAEMLAHLRRGPAHGCGPDGCWVLDRLLSAAPGGGPDPAPSAAPAGRAPARKWWKFWG